MKKKILLMALSVIGICIAGNAQNQQLRLSSPDKAFLLTVDQNNNGSVQYKLDYKGKPVILPSALGFDIKNAASLKDNLEIVGTDSSKVDENWNPVWGEVKTIRNNYNQLIVKLKEKTSQPRFLNLCFRLFNDGLGFRYEFPKQPNLNYFILSEENTEFNLTGNHKTFWIPGDYDTNEYRYFTSLLSEIEPKNIASSQSISCSNPYPVPAVQTPLMMKSNDGLYINIHEASLVNYPAMILTVNKAKNALKSVLVPDAVGNKAYLQAPFSTPWRTIIVSDKAEQILASKLILNLNEPSKIADPSWIKPMKFVGVWWQMHIGTGTWELYKTENGKQIPNGRHAANTENVKKYIDFAAKNNIQGVLVEGWNVGWEDWFGTWKENVFDFITPYPDFDVNYLSKYAKDKGIQLIMHHETSGSVTNYERQMDTAYRFMKKYGYNSLKTGYVGPIIPRGEHHDGQWMINHYIRVAEATAKYQIMLDAHEPVRPTGLHRTYPNWLACEAARGNEFNAWSIGNPPEHETILPFTRLMGGPMDYTPGIFKINLDYGRNKGFKAQTTLCKQLALYVTMYSPLQMACDVPENYESKPDAFEFIKDVAVDWDNTEVLKAEPGDFVVIARKAKQSDNWFLGAITDENALKQTVALSFLDKDKKYTATIYRDADNANWENNPEAYIIEKFIVDAKTALRINTAAGGGCAVSFKPANAENIKTTKKYK